jgi:hypothetical protein
MRTFSFRPTPRLASRLRCPAVEILESRRLLSGTASTSPVVMLAATASDSRSLTISYRIDPPAIGGQPISFGIYRSTDPVYDRGDGLVTTWTIGAGSSQMDSAGQPAGAPGTHTLTIPLPDGLPIDPAQPFVLVVADPASATALVNPAQTASIHTHVIGIVTHGGLQNTHWKSGPRWQAQTAVELRQQGYDAVIAYNWMSASNHAGSAARQGPRLAREIVAAASQFPASDPVDLHFIGHSEGAVVNTQAIVSLQGMLTPGLKAGYVKDTLLDPHAANNAVPGPQYSRANDLLGLLAKAEIDSFQSRAKDPAVFVPSVVNDAEVFYQHTSVRNAHGVNSDIYNLWGQVPVKGPAHYFNLTAAGTTHAGSTGVSQWYANFIAPTMATGAPEIAALRLDGQVVMASPSQPTFTGTAEAGSRVKVYVGPAANPGSIRPAGTAVANSSGQWSLTTPRLAPGRYRAVAMSFSRASHTRPGMTIVPMVPLGSFEAVGRG